MLSVLDSIVNRGSLHRNNLEAKRKITWLFATNFSVYFTTAFLLPLREAVTLPLSPSIHSTLLMLTTVISILGTMTTSWLCLRIGAGNTLRNMALSSSVITLIFILNRYFTDESSPIFSIGTFYLWCTLFNMTSFSLCWNLTNDALRSNAAEYLASSLGVLASAGTLGNLSGSLLSVFIVPLLGINRSLALLVVLFAISAGIIGLAVQSVSGEHECKIPNRERNEEKSTRSSSVLESIQNEVTGMISSFRDIVSNKLLRCLFVYSFLFATCGGIVSIERSQAARRTSCKQEEFAGVLGGNQILQGLAQFLLQYMGSRLIVNKLGPTITLMTVIFIRTLYFSFIILLQSYPFHELTSWYHNTTGDNRLNQVYLTVLCETISRIVYQSSSKALREMSWVHISVDLKYRTKGIVDVIAHRIGTSFAVLLSKISLVELGGISNAQAGSVGIDTTQNIWGFIICIFWFVNALTFGNHLLSLNVDDKKKL